MKKCISRGYMALVTALVVFLAYGIISFAAEGKVQITDTTGKVGEEITIPVSISTAGEPIGDGSLTLNYDSAMLEFVGGDNASGGDGVVSLNASGTGTETSLNYTIVFKCIGEGNTVLQSTGSTAYLFSDETLYLPDVSTNITIAAAGTSEQVLASGGDGLLEISGVQYTIYNDFTDALIPVGFSRTTVNYNGADYNAVVQDASGVKFVFVKSGDSDPIYAMYNESDNHFVLAKQVQLINDQYIYVLGEASNTDKLPKTFGETTLDMNGLVFPVWQDSENKEFYLVNALGPSGQIAFYQYDTTDKTYQRYIERTSEKVGETKEKGQLLDQIKNEVSDNLLKIAIIIVAIIIIMLIIIIVIASKLRNVTDELNQLYDDYDEKNDLPKKKTREQFIRKDDDYEIEYDDYMEEDHDAFMDDEYDDYDEFDDYDDESYETKPLPQTKNKKSASKKSSKKKYDIEFIDL